MRTRVDGGAALEQRSRRGQPDLVVVGSHGKRRLDCHLPESERASHYFHARLPEQFDYVLHFDATRAVEPLEQTASWTTGEVAETFPSGL